MRHGMLSLRNVLCASLCALVLTGCGESVSKPMANAMFEAKVLPAVLGSSFKVEWSEPTESAGVKTIKGSIPEVESKVTLTIAPDNSTWKLEVPGYRRRQIVGFPNATKSTLAGAGFADVNVTMINEYAVVGGSGKEAWPSYWIQPQQ